MSERLPWETIETFPGTSAERLDRCRWQLEAAGDEATRVRALVDLALATYWTVQVGLDQRTWAEVASERAAVVGEAVDLADRVGAPDLVAVAHLGRLYALWGPDRVLDRGDDLGALRAVQEEVDDLELRLRIREWAVLDRLDHGDLAAAEAEVVRFAAESDAADPDLFARREKLWWANLAMLGGAIDDAVALNQEAVSTTAPTAGSPFSFQNVAITVAIERYLRCGLGDVVELVRSIRASSPRVGSNWDIGLAFTLAETGQLDEAAVVFAGVAADDFTRIPRDLNWLVAMHLVGLVALRLEDTPSCALLLDLLRPYADLDATHGSGYASYGPMGRVVARLAVAVGRTAEAEQRFAAVLASRPPGPWTSLTRLDRALCAAATDPARSLVDAERAAAELDRFTMPAWAGRARLVAEGLHLAGHGGPMARREGDLWTLRHPAGTAVVKASRGMDHLVALLGRPGEAVAVSVLDTDVDPSMPAVATVDPHLDAEARAAYRRRLRELGARPAPTPAELREIELLRRELAGGSFAPSSAEIERARVRVTKRLRRAIDAIRAESSGLGDHLSASIQTGRTCAYAPADGAAWSCVVRPRHPSG